MNTVIFCIADNVCTPPLSRIIIHVRELQVASDKPVDPLLHQQLNTLPKESFKLCNSDLSHADCARGM